MKPQIVYAINAATTPLRVRSASDSTWVTALKQSEARNHRQAITDHLTGLKNRQGFERALDDRLGGLAKG